MSFRSRPALYVTVVLARRRAWVVVAVASLTMTVSYVDRTTLAVLAPKVTAALGIDEAQYGWIAAAFSISYLIATPLSGWWIDRTGARRGLTSSVLVWSAIAALHALVPGFATLFCLRIALGLAEGPGWPGEVQTVQRLLPTPEHARGYGLAFATSSIGAMVAPVIAAWLYSAYGWRIAFLGTAVIGLAWLPAWLAVTRGESVRERLGGPRPHEAAHRMSFRALVANAQMLRALIGAFAASPLIAFIQSWGAKYLVAVFQITQAEVGHYLWLPPLCFDLGAVAFGDFAARMSRNTTLPPLRLLYVIATALATAIASLALVHSAWGAMAIVSSALAGAGALRSLGTADLLVRIPAGSVAFAGGILAGAQSLAYIIVNPLIGYALDHGHHYPEIAFWVGAWVVPGSIVWIVWRPAERLEPQV